MHTKSSVYILTKSLIASVCILRKGILSSPFTHITANYTVCFVRSCICKLIIVRLFPRLLRCFVLKMPKRKKTKDFLEDLGSFEFDELTVSRTGRLVEENKRMELDFSGFLGGRSENASGRSNDAHGSTLDLENDHFDEEILEEGSDEERESLSSHNKRKLKLLSSWKKERRAMIKAHRNSHCIPQTAFCSHCLSENPEFRCNDCGPYFFFCLKCLVEFHENKNYLHSPEKWQVL